MTRSNAPRRSSGSRKPTKAGEGSGREGAVSAVVGVGSVPATIRSLHTLTDLDYIDLFTVATSMATDKSAEEWSRAVLEKAPLSRRTARRLWRLLGLRLGPRHSPDYVQGWRIVGRGDNWLRVETASWYMTGQALCVVGEGRVSVSLSLRFDRFPAALVWAFVSRPHQRGLPAMLRQAVRLAGTQT